MARELEDLRDALLRAMENSPSTEERVAYVLSWAHHLVPVDWHDPTAVTMLATLRGASPQAIAELEVIAAQHTEAPASRSVAAAGGGIGVAERLLREADGAGHAKASTALGQLKARQGLQAEALVWYRRGYDGGDVEAAYLMGLSLQWAGKRDEAVVWYREAARRGHYHAALTLADLGEPYADTVKE